MSRRRSMPSPLALLPLAAALLAPTPARAWESSCVKNGNGVYAAKDAANYLCAGSDDATACASAHEQATGVRVGEHALLAARALTAAGLAPLTAARLPAYATTSARFGAAASATPGVPSALGRSAAVVRNLTTLPEFAEAADASYGLADYLTGNEHCFARGAVSSDRAKDAAARGTAEGASTCHDFSSRMGSVNSTHFGAQARASYMHYHGLALEVARRCSATLARIPAADPFRTKVAVGCEAEAMTLEMTGQHFLQDAWSSGHMWQRWGTPIFEATAEGRVRQQVVAMLSGLVHGWRSLARDTWVLSYWQDDQLCMPGFYDTVAPADEGARVGDLVRYGFAGSNARAAAGGDLYLLPCTAKDKSERWAVASPRADSPLRPQYRRVLTCGVRGLAEVYDAGPKTLGARRAEDALLEPGVASVRDEACWGQRVTNRSMVLGSAVSTLARLDDPALVTRWAIERLPWMASTVTSESVDDATWEAIRTRLRVDFAAYGLAIRQAAALRPDGLDASELTTTPLLGFAANGEASALIPAGAVSYLERPTRAAWTTPAGGACTSDTACPIDAYCEGATGAAGAGTCVPKEQAILRVFRDGEIAHWCAADTQADLAQLQAACRAGANVDACTTCVDWVRPHAKSLAGASTCTALGVAAAVIIGTGSDLSADAASIRYCRGR
jgi:hypothetical protein